MTLEPLSISQKSNHEMRGSPKLNEKLIKAKKT